VSGAFNIGAGARISINALAQLMYHTVDQAPMIEYGPPRPGDVRDSLADVGAARTRFDYQPTVSLDEGMREYLAWASTAF
jgi:UDP-glucose 4-epimerase